ncbi:MAG: hypothetical protein ACTH7X_08990 [Brevibacterium aurantiacum]
MSDKTNDDMVTWLRREHTNDLSPLGRDYTDEEIAAALEAADQRAEDTERERDSAMASYEDYLRIRHERDAALAMIEKVQGEVSKGEFDPDLGDWADELLDLLATAPAAVLRERDAEKWEEGFTTGVNHDLGDWDSPPELIKNPYREEQDRG